MHVACHLVLSVGHVSLGTRASLPTQARPRLRPLALQAELPFSMCTFERETDTQISALIHREGAWQPGKRDLFESILPRVNEMMELPERTMVIDVGANIGFYTLLAASRGYDTVAIEPTTSSIRRLLHSLKSNGIKVARSGLDRGINTGHTRMPISFVYKNAASDSYNAGALRVVPENPGANWIVEDGRGDPVTMGACRWSAYVRAREAALTPARV